MTSPEHTAHIRDPLALRKFEATNGTTISAAYGRSIHDRDVIRVEPSVGPEDELKEISPAHLEALAYARHRLAKTGLGSCSTETDQEREVRERMIKQKILE